jgi:hypothetical protein
MLSSQSAEILSKGLSGIVEPGNPILCQEGGELPERNLKKFSGARTSEYTSANEIQNERGLCLATRVVLGAEDLKQFRR